MCEQLSHMSGTSKARNHTVLPVSTLPTLPSAVCHTLQLNPSNPACWLDSPSPTQPTEWCFFGKAPQPHQNKYNSQQTPHRPTIYARIRPLCAVQHLVQILPMVLSPPVSLWNALPHTQCVKHSEI